MTAQLEAIEALTRRANRWSRTVGASIIVGGVAAAGAAYLGALELEADLTGYVAPKVTFILVFGSIVSAAVLVSRVLTGALIRARRSQWIEEAAAEHSLNPADLSDALTTWH